MLSQPRKARETSPRDKALAGRKLPDTPGIYFFLGRNKKILYIGRATSLRNRVRSYFTPDIAEKRSSWIAKMLMEAKSIDFRKTDSVLEAILLEADLIKKFQPPYNTDEKDDKSFNCAVITKEDFPAVLIERSRNIDFSLLKVSGKRSKVDGQKLLAVYGPFTNGFQLQTAMKIIRRIFPYRDAKCTPQSTESPLTRGALPSSAGGVLTTPARRRAPPFLRGIKTFGHPCFNRQIGLCPGVCTGEISRKEYAKTIRNLRLFFEGKKPRLLSLLRAEMKVAAKAQEFEQANEIKKTIFALQHIQDVALLRNNAADYRGFGRRLTQIKPPPSANISAPISEHQRLRIEAYDLSHFGGKEIVGAMTVIENGIAKPSEYRLFKIRGITNAHETKGLQEVLRRRFNHPEWKFPDLIVVDGNEVQKNTAERVLRERTLSIPVVAVVKDEKHRAKEILGLKDGHLQTSSLFEDAHQAILLANSEAHRFALRFQKKRRI